MMTLLAARDEKITRDGRTGPKRHQFFAGTGGNNER